LMMFSTQLWFVALYIFSCWYTCNGTTESGRHFCSFYSSNASRARNT
jgi:hypothetical protein